MATAIGTNQLTSLSRNYVLPQVVDQIYRSNVMFFRLNALNKKIVQGGTQIEVPLNYTRRAAGGFYTGYQALDTSPSDTVKNGVWDWKQAETNVTVDGLTLIRADSPEAVVNFLDYEFRSARTDLAEILGTGVWSDGSNTLFIDGLKGAVDDTTVLTTYAGINRSTNTWWKSQVDTSTTTLTLSSMQTMFGNCTEGGRHPTLLVATQANYNRYWVLGQTVQTFPVGPGAIDEQLMQAGFSNLIFNGVPLAVDSHTPANHIFFLNEEYIDLFVNPRADFNMKEFREPVNQDAMVSLILWAGNIAVSNCARQGKMTALTA